MHYVTGKVRASFVNLEEPNQLSGKYQIDLLMKKGGAEARKLRKAIEEAIEEGVKSYKKWNGKRPKMDRTVLKDGDDKIDAAEKPENYTAYEGMVYVTPKADKAKDFYVFDADRQTVTPDTIYSGCYVRCSMDIVPYAHDLGGKGVTAKLVGLQFLEDGEPLGGTHHSEESVSRDFDGDLDDEDEEF